MEFSRPGAGIDQPISRVLLIGAGAVGGYIGGSLALAGIPVAFVEKPETAAILRQQGFHLVKEGQEVNTGPLDVFTDFQAAMRSGPFDVGIFALKSFDTETAIGEMVQVRSEIPPLVCLQNGVENELLLTKAFGTEKVIAATLTSAISRPHTGTIVLEKLRGIGLAANHALSLSIFHLFQAANLHPVLYTKPESMKWSKLVTNLFANASSAILALTPAEIFSDHRLFHLEMLQVKEALAVMRGLDLVPVNLPGIPFRLLAAIINWVPERAAYYLLSRLLGSGRGAKMPSFYLDLQSGRGRSEVGYLNGAVVRFGEKLGIPTPVNRILTEILLALILGKEHPDNFIRQPDRLLGLIKD